MRAELASVTPLPIPPAPPTAAAPPRRGVSPALEPIDEHEVEMQAASALQRSWSRGSEVIKHGWLSMAGACQQVGACGGDWYGIHIIGDHVIIALGDATGHGFDSALITGAVKGAFDTAVRLMHPVSPERLMRVLNDAVLSAGGGAIYMTCTVAAINCATGDMVAASAGHPLPYVIRRRDSGTRLEQVPVYGPRLGDEPGAAFNEVRVRLIAGDTVLWHSDGVIDCENGAGRAFGHRRLRGLLSDATSLEPADIRAQIMGELIVHRSGAKPVDDIALVCASFDLLDVD